MRLTAVAFLAGVVLFEQLRDLPDARWAWLLPPLVALAVSGRRRSAGWSSAVWVSAGFLWALFRADMLLSHQLPSALEGRDLVAEGTVASVPVQEAARDLRFDLAVRTLSYQGTEVSNPGRVRLTWVGDAPSVTAGDEWRLTVRLKRPRGFMNPGGFDYEAWLLEHRLRATGYVRSGGDNRLLASVWWSRPVDRLRQKIGAAIEAGVPQSPFVGVLKALAIGERGDIGADQWEVFQRTGTAHLVAISGLHIGLVAGIVFWIARWAWVIPRRLPLLWPAPKAAAAVALGAALLYAALAGFSIPTQRSLLMLAAVLSGLIAGRHVTPTHLLGGALLLVLAWDPFAVLSGGFWLSFAAVAVIFYGMTGRTGRPRLWWRWGRVQWLVALGLLPLSVFLFQRASGVSVAANLVAIPWVGFVVVPMTLLASALTLLAPAFAVWPLSVADHAMAWLWAVLRPLAGLTWVQWVQPSPPAWTVAAATVGLLWLLAPRGVPARWVGALWLLPLVLFQPGRPAPGDLELTVLDVGQGLAAVVRTHDHALVYDAGPRYGPNFDAGSAVVVPYLRHAGVKRVDLLVLSHGDSDHVGGAASLVGGVPVSGILTSAPDAAPGSRPTVCAAGQLWHWDDVTFRVLHPPRGSALRDNDASCVLYVESSRASVILPGDIGAAVETALASDGQLHRTTVVIAPHHGSSKSSTSAFVAALQPQWALFSAGYRNRFGFPKRAVVRRYRDNGARVLDTATEGAITMRWEGERLSVDSFRRSGRHWWTSR